MVGVDKYTYNLPNILGQAIYKMCPEFLFHLQKQ
jgi:hypothetical protein